MEATTNPTWRDALAWRMSRHYLDGSHAESVEQVVRSLTTVPSWSGDAELSVGLRRSSPEPGEVALAFEQGRLVKTFAFRGATHYFVPEDVGVYLALRSIGRQWELKSWREFYHLEASDWPALREAAREALSDGPLSQDRLAHEVSSMPRFRRLEAALRSVTFIKPLAWQGDLSIAPGGDGEIVLQALAGVPGFGGLPHAGEAGPRAVLAYLDSYGPASVDNLLYWFGEGLSAGRKNIISWIGSLLGDDVVELEIEGTAVLCRTEYLDELARPAVSAGVRLLPGLDQWVLGPGTADVNVVPPAHRAEISRGANVVLVDGRIEGTWKISREQLIVTRFGDAVISTVELESEAERVSAITGRPLEVRAQS